MIALTALEELLNRLPYGVGLFRYGGSGESEYLNDQYFNLIGYSREEYAKFKNGPIDKLIHHDDLSDVQKCKDQLKHENHTEVEYRIICRGERTLWIKMDASKIEIDGDFMVLSSFRDITKEKLAEMQMSIISNSINSGISMIELRGPEGVPLFTNDAFFDLLGVSREDYEKDPDYYHKHDVSKKDYDKISRAVRRAIKNKGSHTEYWLTKPSGERVYVRRNFTIIDQADSPYPIMLSTTIDMTKLKESSDHLAEERSRYRLAFERANAAIFEWNHVTGEFYASDSYKNYAMSEDDNTSVLNNKGSLDAVHPDDIPTL